jgi:hypothetical protein
MSATAKHRLRKMNANKVNPSMLSIPVSDGISAQMNEEIKTRIQRDEENEDINEKNENEKLSHIRISSILIGGSIAASFVVGYSDIPLTLNLF